MPPAHEESDSELPQWLAAALPMLKLTARVVDYLPSRRAASVAAYFTRLGFDAVFDDDGRQINNTCGVVSARVAVDMKAAHIDEAGSWRTQDTKRACQRKWSERANPLVGHDRHDTTTFYSGADVCTAAGDFWSDISASDVMDWLPRPDTFDFVMRGIASDLYAVARGESDDLDLQILISNTEDCRSGGMHWFTIAYAIQLAPGADRAAMKAAVCAAADAEVRLQTPAERRSQCEVEHAFFYGCAPPAESIAALLSAAPTAAAPTATHPATRPVVCPICSSSNIDIIEGVDMECMHCGYYCGLESDDEDAMVQELEYEVQADLEDEADLAERALEADLEAEAEL